MTVLTKQADGFSLVEVLIATAISATVTALACALAVEAQGAWRVENARVDLHQRARVATDVVSRALLEAGAGPGSGISPGPLVRFAPPVLPRRVGLRAADSPNVFRADSLTVVHAVPYAEHPVLGSPAAAGTSTLELAGEPSCGAPSCGFAAGTMVMLHDSTGNYDIFAVTAVAGLTLAVRLLGSGSGVAYPAGSPAVAVEVSTFFLDAAARVIRRYDGNASDMPLLDDVVRMSVDYFGSTQPPALPRPAPGTANCLYDVDGNYNAALMPDLGGGDPALVALGEETLTDGPWCGSGANQFDADILRIRRVRVTLRLQAADPSVRGTDTLRFFLPGTSRRSGMMVPDLNVAIDVAPRNLRQAW